MFDNNEHFLTNLQPILELFPASIRNQQGVYLVGGCVRDAWLGKASHDIDLVVMGDVHKAARQTARHLDGACFLLDEERNTWRVLGNWQGESLVIDFTAPRAINLEDDLLLRDFSINAMAVSVLEPTRLLDPCNGISDLQKKVIRASSTNSFVNDSVRAIRAVRFAADLHFRIEPQTLKWLKESVIKIPNISPERVRDEIFKIFEGSQPAAAIHVLDKLLIFDQIFPELIPQNGLLQADTDSVNMWQHTLKVVNGLQSIIMVLVGAYHPYSAANLVFGNAVQELGRYRHSLESFLKSCLVPDRPRRGLLYMVSLLQNAGSTEGKQPDENGSSQLPGHIQADSHIAEKICLHYKLSREESHWIVQGVQSQNIIHELAAGKLDNSPLGIYRIYRQYGEVVIFACLIGLAVTLGKYQQQPPQDIWKAELTSARLLLSAWYEKHAELVDPPRLMDGSEIMQLLEIEPGPEVGKLIEEIREMQVSGVIQSRSDTHNWLEQIKAQQS